MILKQNYIQCKKCDMFKISYAVDQGLSTMDGYVVIDKGRETDGFVVDKYGQGPHIIDGSMNIGTRHHRFCS